MEMTINYNFLNLNYIDYFFIYIMKLIVQFCIFFNYLINLIL